MSSDTSDREKVVACLAFLSETCTEALKLIRETVSTHSTSDPPPVQVLHDDFFKILTLIYASTTKIALALKQSAPAFPASIPPLQDTAKHVSALVHCAALFDAHAHGATLRKEALGAAADAVAAVSALAQALLAGLAGGSAGDEYMVRAGAVHAAVEAARAPDGLPADNRAAVRKRWAADRGAAQDALGELEELIRKGESEEEEEEVVEDDGWDELGVDSSDKLTEEELKRAKIVHTLLKLIVLLQLRVIQDILSPPPKGAKTPRNAALDILPDHSSSLVATCDDLVSALHPPQTPPDIRGALPPLAGAVRALQTGLAELLPEPPVEEALAKLNVGGSAEKGREKKRDVRKWFQICFAQIHKTIDSLSGILDESNTVT